MVSATVQNIITTVLTCPGYRHHGLLVLVGDAEPPGEGQLADHHEGGELLARCRLAVILLLNKMHYIIFSPIFIYFSDLVAHRAPALARVVLCRDAEVVAASL